MDVELSELESTLKSKKITYVQRVILGSLSVVFLIAVFETIVAFRAPLHSYVVIGAMALTSLCFGITVCSLFKDYVEGSFFHGWNVLILVVATTISVLGLFVPELRAVAQWLNAGTWIGVFIVLLKSGRREWKEINGQV